MLKSIQNQNKNKSKGKHALTREEYLRRKKQPKTVETIE